MPGQLSSPFSRLKIHKFGSLVMLMSTAAGKYVHNDLCFKFAAQTWFSWCIHVLPSRVRIKIQALAGTPPVTSPHLRHSLSPLFQNVWEGGSVSFAFLPFYGKKESAIIGVGRERKHGGKLERNTDGIVAQIVAINSSLSFLFGCVIIVLLLQQETSLQTSKMALIKKWLHYLQTQFKKC